MPPRILAVAMQKGGVGKTTVSVNLASACAAHLGLRTYLLDFDAQCNATKASLGHVPVGALDLVSVLRAEASISEAALEGPHGDGLRVVPASRSLPNYERLLTEQGKWDVAARELPRLLRRSVPEDADVVILDTPPSLGLWLQVALGMADEVLLVARPEEFSLDGMGDLLPTIQEVRKRTNAALRIRAVLLNNVRAQTNEHAAFVQSFVELFGERVLQPSLPERIAIPAAQREGLPIEHFADAGAQDVRRFFRQLAINLFRGAPAAQPEAA